MTVVRCFMCRRSQAQVPWIVVDELYGAAICEECTERAHKMIADAKAPKSLIERAADKEPPPSAA